MNLIPKDLNGCPFLFLAPMEGVGDRPFRKAMASVGGFDQAVTEFIRVPLNAHVPSLARTYQSQELNPIPLAAQIMGSDPILMAEMAKELERLGAPRIDLNCGCPSNTVTGRGAGSSLLKDPNSLYEIAKNMVKTVSVPVTIKMRAGYEDTSLFKENIFAAQESGVQFITLHPRTKVDGYGPPARWEFIALAKSLLKIPVVGNGDILNVDDALRMLKMTNCDALMIGRGSVINPFIFHQIRFRFANKPLDITWNNLKAFIEVYTAHISPDMTEKGKIGKFKQLMNFLFKAKPSLEKRRQEMVTCVTDDMRSFYAHALNILQDEWIMQKDHR